MKNIFVALIILSVVSFGYAEKFTIAVLPDTQNYCEDDFTQPASINIFKSETQFIADNKTSMNIVFVTHVGDVVNGKSYYPTEWTRAVSAMTTLKTAGVPMGMVPGNHDYDIWTVYDDYKVASNSTYWNSNFGASSSFFSGKSWYGGAYTNSSDSSGMSSWQTFTAGGINFLHLALETNPSDAVLSWASGIIAAHPGYKVIVTTHIYMHDPTFSDKRFQSSPWRTGYSPNCGEEIWNEFIKVNPQIFMVLSGHESYANRSLEKNDSGQKVIQILSDYQEAPSDSAGSLGTGGGWLRLMEFDTDTNMIHVQTYSTLFGKYSNDAVFTDGSTYARTYAPFNYADGDGDGNVGDGTLFAMNDAGSSNFYVYMGSDAEEYYGEYVTGLYKSFYIAPETGSYGVGGIAFDPTSQSVDGNYDRIYWLNKQDNYNTQGLYSASVYNETYSSKLVLNGIASPTGLAVNASGTAYVCYTEPECVWSVTTPSTSSRVATKMLDNYDLEGDDDPVSLAMVPTGFGDYDAGVDLVLFDNGVNDNNDEAIFVVDSTSTSTTEVYYGPIWEDGVSSGGNDIRGTASNIDGYAYFARLAIPSDDSGSGVKCYINRIKADAVLQRVFMDVDGETIASSKLDDTIAVNPADGSIWIAVYDYGNTFGVRAVYRVDVANATLISGTDYMADTTLEILHEYNIGANAMAFSPDGKFLAIGCPDGRDKLYIYNTSAMASPVTCADAIHKGYTLQGDLNSDCAVNFKDMYLIVSQWLDCVDPVDAACTHAWE